MAIFSCIIYTMGEIIFFSVSQLVCYENGLQNKKGTSLGLYRMVYASSRVLGPTIGGFVYSLFGASVIWTASGVIGVMCLLGCLYFKNAE
jgi:MFS family permease